ncbi:DUF1801 domain-containing protein [Clostridium algoriphilum]|uniref:DUF1801 domain-containing protein n=1 Tax=Clostridium algoriphilum TaxID=198347 RepID=UPI001CF54CDC|nr:DUF1801 domain-containing protein [Clostridium algoriphilum]MCB2294229.1 DUF1801 domain-containing protein [Clostridium algoriphilum]
MSFVSINEYINSLDENAKKYGFDFENFMNTEFPQIVPKICFAMPMWWAGPKMYNGYVAVSAAKKHYSIHFHDENYLYKLKEALPNCTFGKRCINVKYGDEHAISIVKQAVSQYLNNIL